jgi:signal transduction histidine kinase
MIPPLALENQGRVADEYRQLVAELFHQLNQPLTTLNCCLELSLKKTRPSAQCRQDMRIALQQVDKITRLMAYLRELVVSENAGDQFPQSDMDVCLKATIEELLPLAKSADVRLNLIGDAPFYVSIENTCLKHALFHLIEFVLNCSRPGSEVKIGATQANTNNNDVELTIRSSRSRRTSHRWSQKAGNQASPALETRIALAIARRLFESVHGSLEVLCHASHVSVQVHLPVAFREPAQPLAGASRRCG